jgi:hypothetical protein
VIPDGQQETQLLVKEGIIIPEIETEERVGFGKGTASRHDLRPSFRNQIKGRKFLKNSHWIGGTQHGHRTCEVDPPRSCSSRGEQDNGRRIKELLAVVLPDPEDIETDPIGRLDFLEKIPEAHHRIDLGSCDRIAGRGDEAVDPNLHI